MAAAKKTAKVPAPRPNPRARVARTAAEVRFSVLFGRNLRSARRAAGLTQQQLADRVREAGIRLNYTIVVRMEKTLPVYSDGGLLSVSLDTAAAICEVLGVSLTDMIANPDKKQD